MSQLEEIVIENNVLYIKIIKDNGKNHRTSIPPNIDPMIQIDLVNQHLESMGMTSLSDEDIQFIMDVVTQYHTPEVIAAYLDQFQKSLPSLE